MLKNKFLLILSFLLLVNLEANSDIQARYMEDQKVIQHDRQLHESIAKGQLLHRRVIAKVKQEVKSLKETLAFIDKIINDPNMKNCIGLEATINSQKALLNSIKVMSKEGKITKDEKEYLLKRNEVTNKINQAQKECTKIYGEYNAKIN